MAAIEVEGQRARPFRARHAVEIRHDAEQSETAVLLDERHRVGVRREQHLLVPSGAVVASWQVTKDRLAHVALEARAQGQRGNLPRLGIGDDLGAVFAVEREGRAVDVGRTQPRAAVGCVHAPLCEPERGAWRQVVYDNQARGMPLDADGRKPVQLTPDPSAVIRRGDARRRRREQRRPFPGRTPLVVGEGVVVEKSVRIRRRGLRCGPTHQNLSGDLALARRMRRVVEDHPRRDAFGRREAGRHAVGRDDRHWRAVGDQLFGGLRETVHVRAPIRPIVDDVVVVRNLHIVEVDGAEFRHLRGEKFSETLPACAARIRRPALILECVPVPGLFGCDQQLPIDR